ncbi:MAG TPA: pilus assembly protein PilM [Alteromonas australica]|uniref:Pilus assembly protein PilM n=3 Tax=Alteromonas australica TaxID=589873 RepID=A0A349TWA4_9ALTE|nr:type IV pilus assembly protein PilM [Alteromonas australica]MAF70783.1 pilus assembly protein PilM [Alteromonas sp.]MBU33150.1 pilus assembly protein PilM [Alteromonas sp.]HAU28319.1 pilus assembly protein PilM [Alteromonas australica]HAW77752.1 pilus assembly protein PilM [Alteromonas australica]HBU50983.1 pilus assembly protein PilM [Alteromonas australica]|tara:strand:- start:3671 stop:4738 length:1068 start_codon:yes stop_codon:yes gene_type:complete
MKSLFKKKLPPIVGLDIGTRQIKAVWIEQSSNGFVLQGYACESISKTAYSERDIKDYEAISLALKKVRSCLKTKLKHACVAVAGSSVINKVVHMLPEQNDYELESQIEIEADSLIPYPIEEVYLDFEELGPSEAYAGKINVLLTAAHKELVDSRLLLAREANFEPKVVDVENFALGNAIDYFYTGGAQDQPICCINIGASLLQVCVLHHGQVVYNKEHGFGLNHLINDISAIHMIERDDVERQLLDGTLSAQWQDDTLPLFASNLQQNINRALQMYMSTLHAERPAKLLMTGGAATLTPLIDILQQDLALDIEAFNPFSTMKISDKLDAARLSRIAPQLAIAAGLASRSFTTWHM